MTKQTQNYPVLIAEMKHANSVKAVHQIGSSAFQVTLVRAGKQVICLYYEHLSSAMRDYSNIFF